MNNLLRELTLKESAADAPAESIEPTTTLSLAEYDARLERARQAGFHLGYRFGITEGRNQKFVENGVRYAGEQE